MFQDSNNLGHSLIQTGKISTLQPLATIGFTNNHLSQLFTKNELTPKQVQESINAFAFDLEENKAVKIKTSLKFVHGNSERWKAYNPPKNYESDEDRLLREQVESEREKIERNIQQMQYELKELNSKLAIGPQK